MTYLLRLSAFLFVLLSFNAKALVINGCTIEPNTYCLSNADLSYFDLSYADLSGADLQWANLSFANLSNANLSGAQLIYANLYNANLSNANLSNASLGNAVLNNVSGQLSDASGIGLPLHGDYTIANNYIVGPWVDLSGADLAGVDLRNTTMTNVGLVDTDLSGADLTGADLTNAFLWNADLTDADLTDAGMLNIFVGGTTYNDQTIFPANFDPAAGGMIFISEVPLPAGITLFLSGLVGLGVMRASNG